MLWLISANLHSRRMLKLVSSSSRRRSSAFNPAREIAVSVLLRVLSGESYAAVALDGALTSAKLDARDAGLATHIVYGTLRHYPSLNAALSPMLNQKTTAKAHALLLAGAFEKLCLGTPMHAVTNEYVNLARGLRFAPPGLVNAVLRRLESASAAQHELPDWLAQIYQQVFGAKATDIFADLLEPQPLWLSLSDQGVQMLEEQGSLVTLGPQGIDRVELGLPLRQTKAFQSGQAQPINPASMACVTALGDVEQKRVLDLAGGVGIKAAMLAARGASVTSVDVIARKHQAARKNLERLGLRAEFITHDLTMPLRLAPAPFVLLDAPCTGSGTLRSHPEIKLRLTPEAIIEMAQLQAQMLKQASKLVEPGGSLVYSVCSITPAEGPELISQFLKEHPNFVAESLADLDIPCQSAGSGVVTFPLNGIDGFFIARLRAVD